MKNPSKKKVYATKYATAAAIRISIYIIRYKKEKKENLNVKTKVWHKKSAPINYIWTTGESLK